MISPSLRTLTSPIHSLVFGQPMLVAVLSKVVSTSLKLAKVQNDMSLITK